ncbi:MAG: hypothetical protein KatS3mg058_2081 [Roseiflexus sp.]|nr:MAG: hypothetical protein KatS3mg058_2081 [Roseiflexus sp.]
MARLRIDGAPVYRWRVRVSVACPRVDGSALSVTLWLIKNRQEKGVQAFGSRLDIQVFCADNLTL